MAKKQNKKSKTECHKETAKLAGLASQLSVNATPSGSKEVSAVMKIILKNHTND